MNEINRALQATAHILNQKRHTRMGCSRIDRFENEEKAYLQHSPLDPWEESSWKLCALHPDRTVAVEKNDYSAPFILRGKTPRVKVTSSRVEIYHDMERVALHFRAPFAVTSHVIECMFVPAT